MNLNQQQYEPMAIDAANANGIPPALFTSLIDTESTWNPFAVSNKGAIGLGQLMPGTAKELGVNAYDPSANISGSAAYLAKMYAKTGNWRDALAAYNAGSGNISAGLGYADSILKAAGMASTAQPTADSTGSEKTPTDAPSFFSDPVGYFAAIFSSAGYSIAFGAIGVLLIVAGIWVMLTKSTTIKQALA